MEFLFVVLIRHRSTFSLRPLQADDAKDMYDTINVQREYLGRWLPFLDSTISVAVIREFLDSSFNTNEIAKPRSVIGFHKIITTIKWLKMEYC